MRPSTFALLGGVIAAPATAATVTVTIPRQNVAEYHRPYVAIWLEPAGGGAARTVALWYETKKTGKEAGTKYLADLRAWWRKGGKAMTVPVDGVTGATRAPGQYSVALPADLRPGRYVLSVEAARETGGRELVTLPLTVPTAAARASGKTELGAVTISAR
ncbi:DUF2271 domain-containing protein [Sphingomonas sp. RP10(2022)]|uniref:DUF2271 domain-containing protein n=1 Tax=Sphingomonas liriopis TaxID=2949094 RepID=A0A9X2HZ45_9SPHN|nr:DUF2271 domain-containing protein [Sphingomonas liriopis]MCP3736248.1 DUF2271 domain-containing protein [Sphingomonas liriopis]